MITYLHISENSELLPHKKAILELFRECFLRELDEQCWEWLYLRNPLGSSIVNLAFLDGKLIGHYAFIPLSVNQEKIFLSITTMVSQKARKYNVFLELAERSYEFAKKKEVKAVVGYPNSNSVDVHRVILGWNIKQTFIAQIEEQELKKLEPRYMGQNDVALKITDEYLQWRLNKPKTHYFVNEGNIYKKYNDAIDLVYFQNKIQQEPLYGCKYNILTINQELIAKKLFDYPFAYKILDVSLKDCEFQEQLLISDVF